MSKLKKVSPKRALACLLALFALLTVFVAFAENAAEPEAAPATEVAEAAEETAAEAGNTDPDINFLRGLGNIAKSTGFAKFYTLCVKFIVPVVMAFVLAGSLNGNCGGSSTMWYIVAGIVLVAFWIFAAVGGKKAAE